MKSGGTCALLLVFLLAGGTSSQSQKRPDPALAEPAIRVDVNRVQLTVNVTDSRGRFAKGLSQEDFRIFDNGKQQPITLFASNEEPAQIVFLIEHGIVDYVLAGLGKSPMVAADALVSRLAPSDRVAVVTFSDRARVALDFTADKVEARRVLKDLYSHLFEARAGSSSLNLSSSLAATLDRLASVPGSKTVILFSTGIDTSPPETLRIIQGKMVTSDVRILAISVFGDIRKPAKGRKLSLDEREERAFVKQGIAEADQWLHRLSRIAGGRFYVPKNAKDFDRAFGEVSQFVRGEYVLEFVPPSLDGRLHSLRVKVKRPWYRIHHRQAYLAPTPPLH